MDKKYNCSICGKVLNDLDSYLDHVAKCGEKTKKDMEAEKNKKYLAEVNVALSKVKAAKDYYNECLKDFKEKYPKEYELNFGVKTDKSNKNVTYNAKTDKKCKDFDVIELSGEDTYELLRLIGNLWREIN